MHYKSFSVVWCSISSGCNFKLILAKYLAACQNIGITLKVVIPFAANLPSIYDNGLTTLLTKNTKTCGNCLDILENSRMNISTTKIPVPYWIFLNFHFIKMCGNILQFHTIPENGAVYYYQSLTQFFLGLLVNNLSWLNDLKFCWK